MTLAALVLAALVAVRPPATDDDAARYADVAAIVADDALNRPLWPVPSELADGSPEVTATALLDAMIAMHESGIDARVATCRIEGPRHAITYWQLETLLGWTREALCSSPALAEHVALSILLLHARRCPRCLPAQIVAAYASGNPGRDSKAAREIVGMWQRAAGLVGLHVYPYSFERPRWVQ